MSVQGAGGQAGKRASTKGVEDARAWRERHGEITWADSQPGVVCPPSGRYAALDAADELERFGYSVSPQVRRLVRRGDPGAVRLLLRDSAVLAERASRKKHPRG